MARFQVVYGTDLWSADGYKVAYYSCREPVNNSEAPGDKPLSVIPLCEKLAEEYGTTVDSIVKTGHYLMAGAFGQYIYTVNKDGKRLFDFYAQMVDDNNLYIRGGF